MKQLSEIKKLTGKNVLAVKPHNMGYKEFEYLLLNEMDSRPLSFEQKRKIHIAYVKECQKQQQEKLSQIHEASNPLKD